MTIQKRHSLNTGIQGSLVLLGFLAIVMFSSVYIVAGTSASPNDTDRDFYCRIFIPGAGGSMSTTEPLETDYNLMLTVPAVVYVQSMAKKRPAQKKLAFTQRQEYIRNRIASQFSMLSIVPQKAEEFTLVGARPSGTS